MLLFNIYIKFTVRKSNGFKSRPSHKCDECEYCCTRSNSLARHKLTHSNKRPFKCDVCEFKFDEGDTLHFAICQRLRCPFLSKVQMITDLFLQICLHLYGTYHLVASVIGSRDKPCECIFSVVVLMVNDISTRLTSHH